MIPLFSLGELYVSDFLAEGESPRAEPAELRLMMDDDGLVHLESQPDPKLMWGRYWYRSATNESMRAALADVVRSIEAVTRLQPGDNWLDIACNDGTLLAEVDDELLTIGVDPADDSFAEAARDHCDLHVQEPFTLAVAERLGPGCQVVTCIAMFYDLLDPTDFLAGVRHILDRNGVFVLQMSYTPLMLAQLAFDNICHEHARYYTLHTLRSTLRRAGFRVVDVTLNDVNGGSFRVFAQRDDADRDSFGSQPQRDVADCRTRALLAHEANTGVDQPEAWRRFKAMIDTQRSLIRGYIMEALTRGETVWGYGASTKGNTLLQYLGLDATWITAIAERQPGKWGLRTVGTDIPIVSEDEMRAAQPDNLLVLPWHFISEFRRREADYLAGGGRLVVPLPRFEVFDR